MSRYNQLAIKNHFNSLKPPKNQPTQKYRPMSQQNQNKFSYAAVVKSSSDSATLKFQQHSQQSTNVVQPDNAEQSECFPTKFPSSSYFINEPIKNISMMERQNTHSEIETNFYKHMIESTKMISKNISTILLTFVDVISKIIKIDDNSPKDLREQINQLSSEPVSQKSNESESMS